MKTILRLSSFNSQNPSPFFPDDKFARIKMCFNSLLAAGADDITILADTANEYKDYFKDYEWIDVSGQGNYGTYREQLRLAEKYDKVLLCEDDYLWRKDVFDVSEAFLDTDSVLFPYNHPGHYTEGRFAIPWNMKMVGNYTFREVPSNTLTFFTRGEFVKNNIEVLAGYGTFDHEMWTAMRERTKIWSPCYSMAKHLVCLLLSPDVSWNEFAKMYS